MPHFQTIYYKSFVCHKGFFNIKAAEGIKPASLTLMYASAIVYSRCGRDMTKEK
eukprot:m.100628 g.100628  ORF g.100628 m.100628 type:complete len:54 (+) comp13715_c0_seq1:1679-1840(+)